MRKRLWSAGLAAICLLQVCMGVPAAGTARAEAPGAAEPAGTESSAEAFTALPDYEQYLRGLADAAYAEREIVINGVDCEPTEAAVASPETVDGQPVLITEASGTVTWRFTVPQSGLYNLAVTYYNVEGKGSNMERILYLDGQVPFEEVRNLTFYRTWTNDGDKLYSQNGNEYRRTQVEVRCLTEQLLQSSTGYRDDTFAFYLTEGEHTLSLEAVSDRMGIRQLRFYHAPEAPSYREWRAAHPDFTVVQGTALLQVQGEDADLKSSSTLYAVEDRTSPLNEPYAYDRIQLNCAGGTAWKYRGDWLQWTVRVPQAGLYAVVIRAKQSFVSGVTVTRTLSVNGEIPFAEAQNLKFPYSDSWQLVSPRDAEGELCYVYLHEGDNTLRLTNTLGELGTVLRNIEAGSQELNRLYRRIRMIVGNTTDEYRDYHLETYIPDLMEIIREQSGKFHTYLEALDALAGSKGEATVALDQVCLMLESFLEKPETIPQRIGTMRDNISSLSSWVLSASEQSLLVDYIGLLESDTAMPRADAPWYAKLWNELQAFFYSFTGDYTLIEQQTDVTSHTSVSLWLSNTVGRDQATIIKQMAEGSFTSSTGIALDLKLVDMSVLLRAVSAGDGPDVSIFMDQSTPVNYGIRSALYDLLQFPDAEEVLLRFSESAAVPFRINGRLYALPESQVFPMLFYRRDILQELGMAVPQTWEELTRAAAQLQKKYMVVSLPTPASTSSGGTTTSLNSVFSALLFQNGGRVYNDAGDTCLLNSKESVAAFRRWSELYTKYKVPVTTNALSYFRTGDAPLVVSDYNFYNSLIVGAPEIKGLWGMAELPGTVRDGTVDRSCSTSVSGCLMYANARNPQASWEFLKWWTSAPVQIRYGQEIEALQGASGRWMTANLEAREYIAWDTATARTIAAQMQWVQGVPEVAGGYYVGRSVDNAVKTVINGGANPQETLLDYVDDIQEEIRYKRKELGLD